jgi:hypothetical protein
MVGQDQSGKENGADQVPDSATPRAERVRREAEEKQLRLAEALRANLHRRKAQNRARTDATCAGTTNEDDA